MQPSILKLGGIMMPPPPEGPGATLGGALMGSPAVAIMAAAATADRAVLSRSEMAM